MVLKFAPAARLTMLIIALTAWFTLGLQLYLLVSNAEQSGMTPLGAVGRFLAFFTILTNLLVAISLTFILINAESRLGLFFSKTSTQAAISLYILIVGIVYNAILRSLWQPVGFQKWADELLHVVIPVLYVCYWLIFVPKGSLKWSHVIVWLLYPALYLAYALIRGHLEGFYPYPFINVTELGYSKVMTNAVALLVVFMAGGALFVGIDKLMKRATRASVS